MVSRAILRRSSKGCHSNELSMSVTQEVVLYLLVTNLAARRCTASSYFSVKAVRRRTGGRRRRWVVL